MVKLIIDLIRHYRKYKERKPQIDKIDIYPNGGFGLKSKHIKFNMENLEKLSKCVKSSK